MHTDMHTHAHLYIHTCTHTHVYTDAHKHTLTHAHNTHLNNTTTPSRQKLLGRLLAAQVDRNKPVSQEPYDSSITDD